MLGVMDINQFIVHQILIFKIEDYSIKGDKKLGNQIYRKLYNISVSNKKIIRTKKVLICLIEC